MEHQADERRIVAGKNPVILLGIESSGTTCGAGVSRDNQLQGEISVNSQNIHSEKLATFAEFIVENLQVTFEDLAGIVVSAGPGSFTGLRIGYSFAKGIAHPLNKPIIEVPTLDVWGYQVDEQNIPIMSVVDAYRKEVFYSVYKRDQNQFKRLTDYSIIEVENLNRIVKENTLISGAISELLKLEIEKALSSFAIFNTTTIPSIGALLELGYQKFKRGEFSELDSSEPFYMRKFKGVS